MTELQSNNAVLRLYTPQVADLPKGIEPEYFTRAVRGEGFPERFNANMLSWKGFYRSVHQQFASVESSWCSNAILFPFNLCYVGLVAGAEVYFEQFLSKFKGCKVIAFDQSHHHLHFKDPNIVFFTANVYKSTKPSNVHCIPGYGLDLSGCVSSESLQMGIDGSRPTVSFCGNVSKLGTLSRRKQYRIRFIELLVRNGLIKTPSWLPELSRKIAIDLLRKDAGIDFNYLKRDHKWTSISVSEKYKWTEEYKANMLGSIYALCVRGYENFSFRFHEALSCGRIPVLIDTDCELPHESAIEWDRHIVRVPSAFIGKVGSVIKAHYESHTSEQLEAIQAANRALWSDKLTPEKFLLGCLSRALQYGG